MAGPYKGGILLKYIYKFSFYQRIQILLLIFIFLPLAISLILSYFIISDEVTGRITASNNQLLNIIATDVTTTIDDISFTTVLMDRDKDFQEKFLKLKDIETIRTSNDLNSFIEIRDYLSLLEVKMIRASSSIFIVNQNDLIISPSDGTPIALLNNIWDHLKDNIDFSNHQIIQTIGVVDNNNNGGNDYFFARNIEHYKTGDFLGTAIIRIPYSYFESLLQSIEMGQLIISDKDGNLIAEHQRESYINENIITVNHPVSRAGWNLKSSVSKNEITGFISGVFFLFFILILTLSVIFLILSIYLSKKLVQPVRTFENVAKKFASGNLSIRYQVRGKDEIAFIGTAFNNMLDQIQDLIKKNEEESEERKVLELQTLFAQIRPHFLINTLNSIKVNLIMGGDQFHSQKIDSLMRLLRSYMRVKEHHTLIKESDLITDYLDIMNMRNDMNVTQTIDIQKGIEDFTIPRLLLQPIIENSIVHGFIDREPDARISIQAFETEDEIVIHIADNGTGLTEEKCLELNKMLHSLNDENVSSYNRVGLMNIAQRLKLTFGTAAFVEAGINEEKGMTFTLHIPR